VAVTAISLVAILAAAAAGQDFEPPPTFSAAAILPAPILRGAHHKVADRVTVDGFYQQFRIVSDYGDLEATGRTVLRTRVAEIGALARLGEVSKTEVFAKAAGGAVLNVGKGFVSAVRDPEATARGVGGGIKRFGVNLGRRAKRAAASVTKDDKKADGPEQPATEKAIDVAGGAANSVFGVNGAARRWARKLGVDPYTTNPLLHQALVEMGKIDAAGSIAAKIVVPVPTLVSHTATVGDLVWGADPEEVRKLNERRLSALGVATPVASEFLVNGNYTLTSQTRLIAALHAVRASGCAHFVSAASDADDERAALYFVESAEMLAGLHDTARVDAVLTDSLAIVARTGPRAILLLPLDRVYWTEEAAKSALETAGRARRELGATALEIRISGTATPAAKTGLKRAGWGVRENVVSGLSVPPAD
jgi:hypothetical protein